MYDSTSRSYCLSSNSPPECSAAPVSARPSNAPSPAGRARHTRSASPAGARDRDRSRRPARPGRPAATVLVLGLLLLGAPAAEAQTPLSCDATDAAITGTVQALESGGNTEVTDVTNLVADCTTLLRLKDELQGTVSLNWDPAIQMWSQLTTGVDWDGIRVSATSHRVIELILPNEGLDGDIPAALANLGGLITLDLRNNPLGDDVTNLNLPTTLTILSLSYTGLTGTIPAALSQLTELTLLELNNNELTGPIPDLSQLTELDRVYLSYNQLSGQIPSLSQLAEMRILDLSNNQLTGQIPPLSGLAALEELFLWNNQLTGPIPASLNELTTLITLSLSLNQLSGPIPDLSNLDNLEIMYLRNNQLTGPIPASLGDLDALTELSLRNNQLSGPIPAALGGLDALTYLWLSSNPLTGPIPATWGDADPDNDPNTPAPHPFADLLSLHLYDTNWTGTDPTDIQALRDKAGLTLWTNRRPTAPEVTDTPLTPGETFTYTVAFSDRDNDTLTYHATLADGTDLPDTLPSNPAPEDLAFDPATQILSGIPPAAGSIAVTVSVTDEDSPNPPTATDPFCHAARTSTNNPPPLCAYVTVIITPDTRRPPTGPSIPAQVATRGRAFSYTVPEFDDPDGPAVIYQASQADGSVLPAWLAFNTTTRTFSGTPPTTGRIDIRVTATDTAYPPSTVSVTFPLTVRAPVTRPPGGGGGGGGGGGPRTSAPDAPSNLLAAAGDGQVVLTWDAPEDDGGAAITDYEYRINGSGPWISTGSTETTHTVTGLDNGREYTFEVRAVNRGGKGGISNRAEATPDVFTLDFAHFANGDGLISDLVFVNVGTHPVRPALYFYDTEGQPMAAESVVDITGDLAIQEDGSLSIQTAMEPLGEVTISTHGQGELVSGSVRVVAFGAIGGVLRFDLPDIGVAGVGASPPVRDAVFPVRRQEGGINTGVAIHNLESSPEIVRCELMREGVLRDAASIPLEANGQTSWFIDGRFPAADTSGFAGSVRCDAEGPGMFTAVALELDAASRIFTTLPVLPVRRAGGRAAELTFAHFANGGGITSDLVFVNLSTERSRPAPTPFHSDILPLRPAIYLYDTEGEPIAAESVVDITGDLEVMEDGGLTVLTEMEPLGVLTISTHGRGELVSGSVRVAADEPIGGVLRFDLPGIGVAGVGASEPVRDVLFPVRRQEAEINTGVAVHNLGEEAMEVTCELMQGGTVLDDESISLAANGQSSWFINDVFTGADTSDFAGSVRCTAPGEGMFTGVAVELDAVNRIFTTLPVVPVPERMSQE